MISFLANHWIIVSVALVAMLLIAMVVRELIIAPLIEDYDSY